MSLADLPLSIRTVSERTGLSCHVIRVWEKRYSTVQPRRSRGNQRIYSDADVVRLQRLRRLTEQGHSIGKLAHLNDEQLNQLISDEGAQVARPTPTAERATVSQSTHEIITRALAAVQEMDLHRLESILEAAILEVGQIGLLGKVIGPLAENIGQEWRQGRLHAAHEHLATATIRTFLGKMVRPFALSPSAPLLVATTPAGQLHELGAALVAASASVLGWRVTYAGTSLPAEEISRIAQVQSARVVALSLIHPEDDPFIPQELARLRRLLPQKTALIAGGRAIRAYSAALAENQIQAVHDLEELGEVLDALRRPTPGTIEDLPTPTNE